MIVLVDTIEQELWAKIYAAAYVEPTGDWADVERHFGQAEKAATRAADIAVLALRARKPISRSPVAATTGAMARAITEIEREDAEK